MNSDRRPAAMVFLFVLIGTIGAGGCQYAINPFVDESEPASTITTPTAEAADAVVPTASTEHLRDWEVMTRYYEKNGSTHWPLWWEDPFEDKGSDDMKFAWTAEDYVGMPYGWSRWLLNTMAWPVSAIVTPPGTIMTSDGYVSKQALGYDHDARKGPIEQVETPPRIDDEVDTPERSDIESTNDE
jgi:hypothetical protein